MWIDPISTSTRPHGDAYRLSTAGRISWPAAHGVRRGGPPSRARGASRERARQAADSGCAIVTSPRSAWRQVSKLRGVPQGITELIDRTVQYIALMKIESQLPIDVLIPAAEKDADVLPFAIAGIRRNIRHPISRIFVVSPQSGRLRAICHSSGCEYVLETDLDPTDPASISLRVGGVDRSRWIYQQFLKLNGDQIATQAHYLVVDADTVMIRPQVFERDGRVVFNYSDEYYLPYFEMYQRLLGESAVSPVSFTSHQMLFSVGVLRELKAAIEGIHNAPWRDAILQNLDREEMSSHSDYDTYGQYAFRHHPQQMAIEYWYNLNLSRRKLRAVPLLELQYGGKYKSASFHSYRSES
jgi:hypothetical protein